MSDPVIGAVVRCGDLVAGVHASVTSLIQGTRPARAIAVVAERSTPASADAWLSAFARERGLRFVRVDSAGPGAAWNAGLGAIGPLDFAVCVEAGDTLESSALDREASQLSAAATLTIVTSGIEWIGPGSARKSSVPAGCGPGEVLADPQAVHVSSMFRWADWSAGPGFDETLPALEHADFWLSSLARGGAIGVEEAPLLRRRVHAGALYKRTWRSADYRQALEALFEKHAAMAQSAWGRVLELSEERVRSVHIRYADNLKRLRSIEHEIGELTARRRGLLTDLPAESESAVDLGSLARTTPISHNWGYERGTPADRPLIESFLARHADDIHGTVLEIQEGDYTRRFGGMRVSRGDVLDLDTANPRATIVGDLRSLDHIETATYDCIILTQTLHVIDDMRTVIRGCERILAPGGVLLASLPAASRVCLEYGPDGDFWRVTEAGARRLFAEVFPAGAIQVTATGNALVNAAFAFGLASEDLPPHAYDHADPYFPMIVGVRAQKPEMPHETPHTGRRSRRTSPVILMYHRVGACGADPHRLSVSEATFRGQVAWLRDSCCVVPLGELAGNHDTTSERPMVALTFDDGYMDNLTVAAPVLREFELPATFFLTTEEGRSPYHYWWDRLAHALLEVEDVAQTLTIDLPSGRRTFDTSTAAQRLQTHTMVYDAIVRLAPGERDAIVHDVSSWAGSPTLEPADRRMLWSEVSQLMTDSRFTIGAHTIQHSYLPAQSEELMTAELRGSRTTLQALTGSSVDTLAYPFGAYDERTVASARAAGFRLAVTCDERAVGPAADALRLPRVEVIEESLDRFVSRIERLSHVVT